MPITQRQQDLNQEREGPIDGFELGVLLRDAYFSLRRSGNVRFSRLEANGDQFVMLKLLSEGGAMNQLDLVKRGGYDPSTTTTMLKSMELRGLIRRERDPSDGRAKIVKLTSKGKKQQKRLWDASKDVRDQLWHCLPAEKRADVVKSLQRIVQVMNGG